MSHFLTSVSFVLRLAAGLALSAAQLQAVEVVHKEVIHREIVQKEVIKSENDRRQYRYLQLENKLRVLLISDPDTDKAAAALDVNVGSGDDPAERNGLAHFLEHMLFLGTGKYPAPDAYQTFVSDHGGSHNAYTSQEHTNYFFDVDARHLEAGLDRFAQFFIDPLFTEKYVDRERHAVNSEYQAMIKDDFRRGLDVYRQVIDAAHPRAKFSVGSLETLADRPGRAVRDDLLRFYRQHYSANNMALVVLGRESPAELEKMVRGRFKLIPQLETGSPGVPDIDVSKTDVSKTDVSKTGTPETSGPKTGTAKTLYPPGFLPAKLSITPEKVLRQLRFTFALPPMREYYRQKPLHFIGNLIGHEGEGSLLSVLKRQGWAEGLSAGEGMSDRHGSSFTVAISLTPLGLEHQEQVRGLLFHTLALIRRQGIKRWRFQEQQRLGDIGFRFQEAGEPIHTASGLAGRLHYYAIEDVLRGDYLYSGFDAGLIRRLLGYLRPDNLLVTLTAPGLLTDKVTAQYRTPYRVETLAKRPPRLEKRLARQIRLPAKNRFIPKRLAVKAVAADAPPAVLLETSRLRALFGQSSVFSVPRAAVYVRVKSPAAAQTATATASALTQMYSAMVMDSLNEFTYPALLAGLRFSVQANSRGLDLTISGYDDQQDVLLDRVLAALTEPAFSEARFASVKQELLRHWRNARKQPPYVQLLQTLPVALFQPYWESDQLVAALEEASAADLKQFSRRLYDGSSADMLVFGNHTGKQARRLIAKVEAALLSGPTDGGALPRAKVVKLPADGAGLLSRVGVDHPDSAVSLYVQGRADTPTDKAHMLVLRQLLKSPFFHQLRTEKQLGYIVFVNAMPLKDVPGTTLVVQSPTASAGQLIGEIGDFVRDFAADLPDSIEPHKQAVVNSLTERPKNLAGQAGRYWVDILHHVPTFDRREQLAAAVAAVSPVSLAAYYRQVLLEPAARWWWVAGDFDVKQSTFTPVAEYDSFKGGQSGYTYP